MFRFVLRMQLFSNFLSRHKSIVSDLVDFIFPPYCAVCEVPLQPDERVVCENCFQYIRFITPPFCQRCGRPLKRAVAGCRKCKDHKLNLARIRALGLYDDTLLSIIHLLKYEQKPSLAKRLGRMMSVVVLADHVLSRAELVIPVPLHPVRYRERGYNQSELLAGALADSIGLSLVTNVLVRKKNTKSQTNLSPEERFDNVAGAFGVKEPNILKDKRVLLVDDVMTTGSTLYACAEALLSGGANEVYGINCAVVP